MLAARPDSRWPVSTQSAAGLSIQRYTFGSLRVATMYSATKRNFTLLLIE